MLDLRKLDECQRKWSLLRTTLQYAGKQMNCTADTWQMYQCTLFSNGVTSLLYAFDTFIITQTPFDKQSLTFNNLSGIWSYNVSEGAAWNSTRTAPSGIRFDPRLTGYGLFGIEDYYGAYWLYNDNGVRNGSTRVGFCFEDEAPYVTYRDAGGNIFWSPNATQFFKFGTPPSSLVIGPTVGTSVQSTGTTSWGGIAIGTVVLFCLIGAVIFSQRKPAASTSEPGPDILLVPPRNMNDTRRDDIEALPLYQEHEAGSSAVSLNSSAQSALPAAEQAGQVPNVRNGLDSWTTDEVVAWVRLNGGDESMEQVVRMEGMDGSVIESLDVDDLLSVFAFETDAERERMKNALVSLKSQGSNNAPPRYR
ncbi:hypothetical protein HDU81_005417 [Chytriomyces hyalinus]|nr:hypothetical protein HDU81_005417 [Chytriomyces hyalinus]